MFVYKRASLCWRALRLYYNAAAFEQRTWAYATKFTSNSVDQPVTDFTVCGSAHNSVFRWPYRQRNGITVVESLGT